MSDPSGPGPGIREARSGRQRFFHNYNRAIGMAYGGLLLGLSAFFAFLLHQGVDDELALIRGQVERHGQFLEFVLRSSTDQIEAMRMSAAADLASGRGCAAGRAAPGGAGLQASGGGFHRDALAERDAGGNLVGDGPLAGRAPEFYCDLGAALGLDNQLGAMAFQLPNAARARFITDQGFYLQAPWQPSRGLAPPARLLHEPVWRQGLPAANPDRTKYWAPPYFGGEDAGLLAPVAVPAYDRDRFVGVIALDLSLDYLNRINSAFGYPLGRVSVVDAQGRVLAHPGLYRDPLAVREAPAFERAFDRAVLAMPSSLVALQAHVPVTLDDWVFIRRPFVSAPWQLVYAVQREALWRKLLLERGPAMAGVLAALMLLMAVTYAVTLREFVGPAAKLVAHVEAESTLAARPVPRVPASWRPWFDAISRAFRESVQLGSLRKEVDIAARMQQSILPRHWPQDPRFTLVGTMRPAKDIGGDFYDHFWLAGGACGFVVADVSGKGISAGLFGMVSKTLLRLTATQRQLPPGSVAREVNDALCADNESSMFVTAFYARYTPGSGELVYVNAGHPPPLLLRADGRVEWLPGTGGTAFGVMEDLDYEERVEHLAPGDTLLVFTDGVTEAVDGRGEEFGRDRLGALFEGQAALRPDEAIDRVVQAVAAFAGEVEQFDDITCVVLHCVGQGEGE